jgi:hypothetical protein
MTFWSLLQQLSGVPAPYLKLAEAFSQQDAFGSYAPIFGPTFGLDVEHYRVSRFERFGSAGPAKAFEELTQRVWSRLNDNEAGVDDVLDLDAPPAKWSARALSDGPVDGELHPTLQHYAEHYPAFRDGFDPAIADYLLSVAVTGELLLRDPALPRVFLPFQIPRVNLTGTSLASAAAEQKARALRLFDRIRAFEMSQIRGEPALRAPTLALLVPVLVGKLEPRTQKEIAADAGVALNSVIRFSREYPDLLERVEREGDRSGEHRFGGAVMLSRKVRSAYGLEFDAYIEPGALALGGEGKGPVSAYQRVVLWLVGTYGGPTEEEFNEAMKVHDKKKTK